MPQSKSLKNKSLLLSLLGFCFILSIMFISSVYAQASAIIIDNSQVGDTNIASGELIAPTPDDPLKFHWKSEDSLVYTCRIVLVDETLFHQVADQVNAISNIEVVGTEISNIACGTGTESNIEYPQVFSAGHYVFEIAGTSEGVGTKTDFAFEVQGGAASLATRAEVGAQNVNVNQFWTKCDDTTNPATHPHKIVYTMEGRSKIDRLKFEGKDLDLKVNTNTNNDHFSGKFESKSSEDYTIQSVNTQCFYNLPEHAGQKEVPGIPTIAFNPTTQEAWNPPVPQCANNQVERTITYPFKVTSNLNELKDTGKRDVKVKIFVDLNPDDQSDIDVRGELILGGKKEIGLEINADPGVQCSGKSLVG